MGVLSSFGSVDVCLRFSQKAKSDTQLTDKTKRTTKPPTTLYNLTTTNTNSDTFHRTTIKNFAMKFK